MEIAILIVFAVLAAIGILALLHLAGLPRG